MTQEHAWDPLFVERLLVNTHLTTWELLERAAATGPDQTAVVIDETTVTYAELQRRAAGVASRLHEFGVGHGTVVAFAMEPCLEWVALHYALGRLGAVALPLNYVYSPRELVYVLELARPDIVVAAAGATGVDIGERLAEARDELVAQDLRPIATSLDHLAPIALSDSGGLDPADPTYQRVFGENAASPGLPAFATRSDDPAYIVFTSGSTAAPKGALVPHRGLAGTGTSYAHGLRLTSEDRFLNMLPTFHVTGPSWLSTVHSVGAAIHLIGSFNPARALLEIEQGRCTSTFSFPTHFMKMLGDPSFAERDVRTLKRIGLGGSRSFWEHLHEHFELEHIVTVYGSTECSSLGSITVPAAIPDSHGYPLPGMEFRIVDPDTGTQMPPGEPGEICFRGWAMFLGYLGLDRSDAFDEEGFFHTGDFGHIDADGALHYRGRYKMMIKTGGENVAELEVEVFLEDELDIVEVAQVVGVPDPVWGEAIVAFVQLSGDAAEPPSTDELRDLCRGKIANFKIPKHFIVVEAEEWPLLPNTKIDKHALRERAASALAQVS